jgi:hypothetical protein
LRVLVILMCTFATGCAATFREQVSAMPPEIPRTVPWDLNRELLLPETKQISFVVEWVEGHEPEWEAVNALVRLASRYGGRPASWRRHEANAPLKLEPDTTYVLVRYVGNQTRYYGMASSDMIDYRQVYVILINQEAHRPYRMLIPQAKLEEQTLVHEYGHHLGLPTHDHGYLRGGMHCVNPNCALASPRLKAIIYNAFHIAFGRHYLEDYCEECRRAIDAARKHWGESAPSTEAAEPRQNTDRPVSVVNRSSASTPATELPRASSPGLHTHRPQRFGMTATMPPPTPLLPGRPTR